MTGERVSTDVERQEVRFPLVGSISSRKRHLGLLAVIDQSVFSGTNFITAVMLGRLSGPRELGIYALAFSIIMLTIGLQRALLISPFVIVYGRTDEEQMKSMRGSLLMATLFMGALLTLIALIATPLVPPGIALAMAIALPAGLMRDFGRRLAIAEMKLTLALVLDIAIGVSQIAVIGLLVVFGQFSAIQTLLACALVWIAVAIVGLLYTRSEFRFRAADIPHHFRTLWPIGRWIGMSQMLSTTQAFALPWVMAISHSMTLAGIYAACWTVLQVASPAIEGLGNLLGPALAKSATKDSMLELRQRVRAAAQVFAAIMLVLMVAVAFFGKLVLLALYGTEYSGYYNVLLVLTAAAAITNLGIPPGKAMTQLGYAEANFWITFIALGTSVAMAFVFLFTIGATGAAWGLVIGSTISTSVRWMWYRNWISTNAERWLASPANIGCQTGSFEIEKEVAV